VEFTNSNIARDGTDKIPVICIELVINEKRKIYLQEELISEKLAEWARIKMKL